jgi:hypothetical protein
VGEFNHFRLVLRGNHGEHWLNGVKVVEYELDSPKLRELIAQSKFKDMTRFAMLSEGHICIQHHGQEVWYRNIRVRIALISWFIAQSKVIWSDVLALAQACFCRSPTTDEHSRVDLQLALFCSFSRTWSFYEIL